MHDDASLLAAAAVLCAYFAGSEVLFVPGPSVIRHSIRSLPRPNGRGQQPKNGNFVKAPQG